MIRTVSGRHPLYILEADRPYPRLKRLCRPLDRVRMLPQPCGEAAKTGLKGGVNARDQLAPSAVEGIAKVYGTRGDW